MRRLRVWTAAACLVSLAAASAAAAAPSDRYVVHNILSSDTTKIAADRADPNLRNPWGLVASAASPWWPANERSNTSTIFCRSTTSRAW